MKPQYVTRLVNQVSLGGVGRVLDNILEREQARGFKVLRPGDVEWFPLRLWKPASIISTGRNRVRIVLLEARQQKTGAFSRLLADIADMEMIPVVVEPHDRLALTLANWGWRSRVASPHADDRETIWYPRA